MDGARVFNAAVALGVDVKEFAKHVDSLMFCLSKGLSCPVGSLVVGTREFVERARKNRKLLGGGMRQAGVIAAPGIIALEKMVGRLEEDHRNAKVLAEGLAKIDGLRVDLSRVQTNMVLFDIGDLGVPDEQFLSALRKKGVLAVAMAKNRVRLVTHRGIEREHVEKALMAIESVVEGVMRHG
jgi:threonine aldolase